MLREVTGLEPCARGRGSWILRAALLWARAAAGAELEEAATSIPPAVSELETLIAATALHRGEAP